MAGKSNQSRESIRFLEFKSCGVQIRPGYVIRNVFEKINRNIESNRALGSFNSKHKREVGGTLKGEGGGKTKNRVRNDAELLKFEFHTEFPPQKKRKKNNLIVTAKSKNFPIALLILLEVDRELVPRLQRGGFGMRYEGGERKTFVFPIQFRERNFFSIKYVNYFLSRKALVSSALNASSSSLKNKNKMDVI